MSFDLTGLTITTNIRVFIMSNTHYTGILSLFSKANAHNSIKPNTKHLPLPSPLTQGGDNE